MTRLILIYGAFFVVWGIVLVGVVILVADRIPGVGRLPGDVVLRRGPVTFYFPLATSIVLSVLLTILLNLFWRR